MKRKLFWSAVLFAAGIYAGVWLKMEYCIALWLVLLLTLLLRTAGSVRQKGAMTAVVCLSLSFVLGGVAAVVRNDITLRPLYEYEGETVDFVGVVRSRPEEKERSVSCDVTVRSVTYDGKTKELREDIRLTISRAENMPAITYGNRIKCTGILSLPDQSMNEGGFDYRMYLRSKGVFYTGYAYGTMVTVEGSKWLTPVDGLRLLRYRFSDVVDEQLTGQTAAVLKGILFGDKSGMTGRMSAAFSASGLSHIVAVSGMHVGYILLLLYVLTDLLKIRRWTANLIAAVLLLAYMLLVGTTPSVIRATVLGLIAIFGKTIDRRADTLTSMGAAALVILLLNPLAAFDTGFMLSFAAALGIVVFARDIEWRLNARFEQSRLFQHKWVRKVGSILCVTISAQIFTIPILMLSFGEVSLWGLLTGVLVTPIMPLLMAAGFVLCILGSVWQPLALPAAGLCFLLVSYVQGVARAFAALPTGVLTPGTVTPYFLLLYGALLACVGLALKKRTASYLRYAAAAAAVIAVTGFGWMVVRNLNPQASVTFINVGQGDCSLVSVGKMDLLIDAGGLRSDTRDSNIGTRVVAPYLKKRGIKKIEAAMVSHYHDDHARGMLGVLDSMKVERLLMPVTYTETELERELKQAAKENGTEVVYVAEGSRISLGDAQMDLFTPDKEWLKTQSENQNNNSIVGRLDYGETSVLYTGDMEAEGEELLLAKDVGRLDSDILKVGHHGSKTSSCTEFLEAVSPDYAVISVGEDNEYGHPHEETMSRLEAVGARVLQTKDDLDITFYLTPEGIREIRCGGIG